MASPYEEQIRSIILRARADHLKALKVTEKKLLELYKKAADDVGKIILTLGDKVKDIGLYYTLRDQLESRIRQLSDDATELIEEHLNAEAARGIRATDDSLRFGAPGLTPPLIRAEFLRIYHEAVQALMVTVEGIQLSDHIWSLNQVNLQRLREILLEGMVSGRSFADTYRLMKGYLRLSGVDLRTRFWKDYFLEHPPGRGVYRSPWKNVMRVIRTETNRAFREGAQLYAQGKTWAKGMRFNLSDAHPEPDVCDDLANHDSGLGPGVYPVGQAPTSPHPHCLCYLTVEIAEEVATTSAA